MGASWVSLLVIRCIGDDTHHVTPQRASALPHNAVYYGGMTAPPWTILTLRELAGSLGREDGDQLVQAVAAFVAANEKLNDEARDLRNAVIASWDGWLRPAEAARRSGLSVSQVRNIQALWKAAQR